MISLALSGLITGAAKQELKVRDEDREAKRKADEMAIKRISDMEDFSVKLDMTTASKMEQEKAKFKLKEEQWNQMVTNTLGEGAVGGGMSGSNTTLSVAKEYFMAGNPGRAAELLATPDKLGAAQATAQKTIRDTTFETDVQVKFKDGKTTDDVYKVYEDRLASPASSPAITQSSAGRMKSLQVFTTLFEDVVGSLKDEQGQVNTMTSRTVENVLSNTTRQINLVKEGVSNKSEETLVKRMEELDEIIPMIQDVYDPSGSRKYNIFANANIFTIKELQDISTTLRKHPDKFPNIGVKIDSIRGNTQTNTEPESTSISSGVELAPANIQGNAHMDVSRRNQLAKEALQ